MSKRMEHKPEAIKGEEKAESYGKNHNKLAKLLYRALIEDISAFNISGQYLEVGAGTGILAVTIAENNPGIGITCVDLLPHMAAMAEKYIGEKKLQKRIRYDIADVRDKKAMQALGKFDLIYSAFSLHHWKEAEQSIRNLWDALRDNGILYIYDLKRVSWLYFLPLKGGFIESIRASYKPCEIELLFQNLGIKKYEIKASFPFFMQSIIAYK